MEALRKVVTQLSEDSAQARPLCVSLDGALVRADLLWECVLLLVRKRPQLIFLLPIWMLGGRARLERAVTERNVFDAATLPYRSELIEWLQKNAEKGRRLVLVSATSPPIAEGVAQHLALFEEVVTCEGPAKADGADKHP